MNTDTYTNPDSYYEQPVQSNITTNTSPYSDEQRREAVIHYLASGKYSITAKRTGIPITTICYWRNSDWWDDVAASVRAGLEDESRAKLQAITHKALDSAIDRLDNGETYVSKGEQIRVPVKARDAMLIAAMAYDKLRLSLNLPGRITDTGRVDSLADQLAKLSAQVNATVVSEQ